MPQGEGSIIDGTGSQTGSQRWGDYTSMNVDPVDDCTFWYVNEYVPTTSSVGWRLRIGAFKFAECGTPDFYLGANPANFQICAGSNAYYTVTVGSVGGFTDAGDPGRRRQPRGYDRGLLHQPGDAAGHEHADDRQHRRRGGGQLRHRRQWRRQRQPRP